jgi:hypothetical protein
MMFPDCRIRKLEHVQNDMSKLRDCDVWEMGSRGLKKKTIGKFRTTKHKAQTLNVVRKPYE